MYVSRKPVGVGVLDDPAVRLWRAELIGRVRNRYVRAGVEPRPYDFCARFGRVRDRGVGACRGDGSSRTPTPTGGLVSYPQRSRGWGAYSGAAHRGRCALRLRCCVGFERGAHRDGWSAVVAVGAGFHPRPDIKSKRLRRFTFSQRLLEEMRPFSASTTSVDISNRRRPTGGRYLVLNRYPGRPTPYISAQPAYRAQTSDRTSKVRGRGGWDASSPMGALSPYKSRFSLGRHSRFFGQGPKKWGGIL